MTDLTFIHAADLHLDSPFYGISNLPEPVYARIKESTFHSVRRLTDGGTPGAGRFRAAFGGSV